MHGLCWATAAHTDLHVVSWLVSENERGCFLRAVTVPSRCQSGTDHSGFGLEPGRELAVSERFRESLKAGPN
ncbi:hypothetical protein GCM10012275_40390 [Longimycelium tulufanense]|uniref:Uncharacterized protein n=1 Tax=Longimycelium tulufanense TaxID=907463 RepID=A0A8J3CAI8_9PSEU|nr:hypothetical protein GCM10012275_40390 [Longimycelium tulufanense]